MLKKGDAIVYLTKEDHERYDGTYPPAGTRGLVRERISRHVILAAFPPETIRGRETVLVLPKDIRKVKKKWSCKGAIGSS